MAGVSKITIAAEDGDRVLVDLTGDNVTADSLVTGHTAHGADGEIVEGANPYELETTNAEVGTQTDLISQIRTALQGKAAGGGSAENLDTEISEQAAKIDQLLTILDGKATGGGVSKAEVPWLTREVTEYSNPTLTKLGAYALSGTQVTSLDLPELTTITGYTFRECMALANMVFPKLEEVPYNGCREWKGLVKADFHALKTIGANGFYQCSNLETLIIRTPTMCTLASGSVFTSSKIEAGTGGIYFHREWVDAYKAASNWSKYAAIIYAIEDYPEITGG